MRKRLLTESTDLTEADLKRMLELGCFSNKNWVTVDVDRALDQTTGGTWVVVGWSRNTNRDLIFYPNGYLTALAGNNLPEQRFKWNPREFCPSFYEEGATAGLTKKTLGQNQKDAVQSLIGTGGDYVAEIPAGTDASTFEEITVEKAKQLYPNQTSFIERYFQDPKQVIFYQKNQYIVDNKQAVRDKYIAMYKKHGYSDPETCESAALMKQQDPQRYIDIIDLSKIKETAPYFKNTNICLIKLNQVDMTAGGFGNFITKNKDIFVAQTPNPTKTLCKDAIDQYYFAMEKKIPINTIQLQEIKMFLKDGCNTLKFMPNYRNKLNTILQSNTSYNPVYGLNGPVRESVNLSKTIRKYLLEYKEEKKKLYSRKKNR